jgi:glycosyltransferase involved in cell wall biosynthesis
MKIALLTDGIYPYVIGGMQKHSFYLAKYFALNKIEVSLYHTSDNLKLANELSCFTEDEKKYIKSFAVKYPDQGKLPGHYIREMYSYSRELFNSLKQNKNVDFIYIQGLCGMYLLEHKKDLNVPVGINFHGLEMFQKAPDFKSKLQQFLFKGPVIKCLKSADLIFSLGGNLTKILIEQGISRNKISQISIGIDKSWVQEHELSVSIPRTFVFIGRYERRKGIQEINIVLKKLLPEHSFQFDFIGDIPDSKKVKSSKIIYHGKISDVIEIQKILSRADVLVCPSYSEGMPTVILEAMASGMAIIASDVGAVSEQVGPTNGTLIRPGDTTGLYEAMVKYVLMEKPELWAQKQNSLSKIKKSFLWDSIIQKTISEISKIKD